MPVLGPDFQYLPMPICENAYQPIRRPLERCSMNAVNFRVQRNVEREKHRQRLGIAMMPYEIINATQESLEGYLHSAEYPAEAVIFVMNWWKAETKRADSAAKRRVIGRIICPKCCHEFFGRGKDASH